MTDLTGGQFGIKCDDKLFLSSAVAVIHTGSVSEVRNGTLRKTNASQIFS